MRRTLTWLSVALLAGLLVPAAGARADGEPPMVLVYGDSLVDEAQSYIRLVLDDVARVRHQVVGASGGAVCDLHDAMRRDVHLRPAMVVIAFSGNAFTPCMRDEQGESLAGDALFAKYHHDLVEAIKIFRPGAPTIWLGTYPTVLLAQTRGSDDQARMNSLSLLLASQNPRVRVADSGAAVLFRGEWTRTLHCLPKEPCEGGVDAQLDRVNVVRSHDTAHFCPMPVSFDGRCATHSSGAMRYGVGLVRPGLATLGRWDQARADGTIVAGWPGEAGR